jgi:hypothetical protein
VKRSHCLNLFSTASCRVDVLDRNYTGLFARVVPPFAGFFVGCFVWKVDKDNENRPKRVVWRVD